MTTKRKNRKAWKRYVLCDGCGRQFDRTSSEPTEALERYGNMTNTEWVCPLCGTDNNPAPGRMRLPKPIV